MSIIKDFTFNGRTASSFGVQLADNTEWWATPERDMEHISVPGRSGDLLIDNGRFNNMEINFEVNRVTDGRALSELINWLALNPGYQRLSVSDDPDHYRLASFEGMTVPVFTQLKKSARITIPFNCQPQRYLVSDQESGIEFGVGTENPTLTLTNYGDDAKPKIFVAGGGSRTIRVSDTTTGEYISLYAFAADENRGSYIDTQTLQHWNERSDGTTYISDNFAVISGGWSDDWGDQEPFIILRHGHTYTFTGASSSVTGIIWPRRWEL